MTAFSRQIGKAYHISQRYQYRWTNVIAPSVLDDTNEFKNKLVEFKLNQQQKSSAQTDNTNQQASSSASTTTQTNKTFYHLSSSNDNEEMFVCTEKDDIGMTSFLAHTMDNADVSFFFFIFIFLINQIKSVI